jgi:CheY-like chemotaxis protein
MSTNPERTNPISRSPRGVRITRDTLRVLIVDPHPDEAESLATLLVLWGHETHVVPDGSAALTERRQFEPDGVLIETELSDISGSELVERIRSVVVLPKPPLVAGMTSPERAAVYSANRAFDYPFAKPLNLTYLNRIPQFHRGRLHEPGEAFPRGSGR